ncbi:hypothetical protein BC938DRAFT_480497 [Jimgerdemannia flammicorona]|uniref:NADH dehydrogenase [ubiquinone] 1 beta subcomplex subunit 9 n=1 Tax=Jimgerdemannia flammicorona TaxID=994334 RepID=A0A433QXA0_9FUNG|nr:hypothetical protein BC938DRAFT_480497 [Jimgerdemannia flammicorona]
MSTPASFQAAHRASVQSLYRRSLKLSLDWYIRRDLWRQKALEIRSQFEANKHVTSPRELEALLAKTEQQLAEAAHPDPYRTPLLPKVQNGNATPRPLWWTMAMIIRGALTPINEVDIT